MKDDLENIRGWVQAVVLSKLGLLFLAPASREERLRVCVWAGLADVPELERVMGIEEAEDGR